MYLPSQHQCSIWLIIVFWKWSVKKKKWCKRWLETQVIWFLTPSPGLEDSSWGITLQNTWLRGRISGEKFRTCKGYHPLLELHLSGTAQTLVSLCCTFDVTRALCLLLRRGIITWKDCESIPVEKVDMTIVPMAIRKLWKQKSKEDFEKKWTASCIEEYRKINVKSYKYCCPISIAIYLLLYIAFLIRRFTEKPYIKMQKFRLYFHAKLHSTFLAVESRL